MPRFTRPLKSCTDKMEVCGRLWRSAWPFLAGFLALFAFDAVGRTYLNGYVLDLGSITVPAPRHATLIALWTVLGVVAAGLIGLGFLRLAPFRAAATRLFSPEAGGRDATWILALSLLAFLVPLSIRLYVLEGAPLTDDESCYRFSAQLLAQGRLKVPSPPLKVFFDRAFMINDGFLYSQYPLGWPALMVPGVFLSLTGYLNAVYSALTIPALYLVLRRMAGSGSARLGSLLALASPFLMVGAATELSHTSCVMALAWAWWFALRSADEDSPLWSHAGVSGFFGLAVFIRPASGLGVGLPFLVYWAAVQLQRDRTRLLRATAAFAGPAILLGSLFLAANAAQTGSALTLAYQRSLSYARENGYVFSNWTGTRLGETAVHNFDFGSLTRPLANTTVALVRLNADLFGWPFSLLFCLFAGWSRPARIPWASTISFLSVSFFLTDSGVDSFGPSHYFEVALPALGLTVLGIQRAGRALGSLDGPGISPFLGALPVCLTAGFVVAAVCGYVPARLGALARVAVNINLPTEVVRRAGIRNAVIFAARPFARNCLSWPTHHYVYWRPNNDPDLKNDVLWVNHVSLEADRALLAQFPGRKGYLQSWEKECQLRYYPLESLLTRPSTGTTTPPGLATKSP